MNVLELMLNDFVECLDGSHEEKVYAQVIAIEEGQDCILVEKDHTCNWFLRPEYLEPIPLTTEILILNGFIKETSLWTLYNKKRESLLVIHFERKKFFIYTTRRSIHIPYVHILQHVLRLCGLRELADNFKLEEGGAE